MKIESYYTKEGETYQYAGIYNGMYGMRDESGRVHLFGDVSGFVPADGEQIECFRDTVALLNDAAESYFNKFGTGNE